MKETNNNALTIYESRQFAIAVIPESVSSSPINDTTNFIERSIRLTGITELGEILISTSLLMSIKERQGIRPINESSIRDYRTVLSRFIKRFSRTDFRRFNMLFAGPQNNPELIDLDVNFFLGFYLEYFRFWDNLEGRWLSRKSLENVII
jgi:hypothetical protein